MGKFALDNRYIELIKSIGIDLVELLRKAALPLDFFAREAISVTSDEYLRLIECISMLAKDDDLALKIGLADNMETLSPPIFATYCSKNAQMCIERLATYKKLVGPILLITTSNDTEFTVEIAPENGVEDLPGLLIEIEIVILINLIRSATKENIVPISVTTKHALKSEGIIEFLGIEVEFGDKNLIVLPLKMYRSPLLAAMTLCGIILNLS